MPYCTTKPYKAQGYGRTRSRVCPETYEGGGQCTFIREIRGGRQGGRESKRGERERERERERGSERERA